MLTYVGVVHWQVCKGTGVVNWSRAGPVPRDVEVKVKDSCCILAGTAAVDWVGKMNIHSVHALRSLFFSFSQVLSVTLI
jgi:hypothetical protein